MGQQCAGGCTRSSGTLIGGLLTSNRFFSSPFSCTQSLASKAIVRRIVKFVRERADEGMHDNNRDSTMPVLVGSVWGWAASDQTISTLYVYDYLACSGIPK